MIRSHPATKRDTTERGATERPATAPHPAMPADPARGLTPSADSPEAAAVLAAVLAAPRDAGGSTVGAARGPGRQPRQTGHPRRPARRTVHRLVACGVLAGAAAAAAVGVPLPWGGSTAGTAAAYAVRPAGDGAVSVVVHWNQLADPAALQSALDRAGAPVRVLVGTPAPAGTPVPDCAKPYFGLPYSERAVSWDSGRDAPDSSIVIRPGSFPPHATLVIEVTFAADGGRMVALSSFMARGRVPTCAAPVASAP